MKLQSCVKFVVRSLSSENHLDEDNTYEEKIRKFQQSFEAVHTRFNLSETHVFYSHVKDYISKCGHTLAMFSDEPIETSHGRLRFMERRHNFRCRSLVRKYKSQRSKASFDMWNRKNLYSIDKKKWKIKRYWWWNERKICMNIILMNYTYELMKLLKKNAMIK